MQDINTHLSTQSHMDTQTQWELFCLKKEENSVICDNMVEPWGHYLSEISQTEKDKHYMVTIICAIKESRTYRNGKKMVRGERNRERDW